MQFFKETWERFLSKIGESPQFQMFKETFEQLDPIYRRLCVQVSSWGLLFLVFCFFILYSMKVSALKKEVRMKQKMFYTFEALKAKEGVTFSADNMPKASDPELVRKNIILDALEVGIQITDKDVGEVKVLNEKAVVLEQQTDLQLKRINLRQMVQLVEKFESSKVPMMIHHIHVKTDPDLSGYLDVFLSVSVFGLNTV